MPEKEPAVLIGKVIWNGKATATGGVGYHGGLEELERDIPEFRRSDGPVFWFCRDVGISVIKPGNETSNVLIEAADLLTKSEITPQQLKYIYEQFGFDPAAYIPPKWWNPKIK